MTNSTLDHDVSRIIFGRIDREFQPSHNEGDAWIVINWLHQQHVTIHAHDPRSICRQVIAHSII
ncbi:MAG: hypothetical protein HRU15_00755 [Planctomycetes bacterium]|nr:hypothetical protein [Planctomycetota bacterium]